MDKKRLLGHSLLTFSISIFVAAVATSAVLFYARHEEHQVIAQLKNDVVELYQVDNADDGAVDVTGLTEWRRRGKDSILEIDSDDDGEDEPQFRPQRIRQRLFDGSRIESIGRGLLWLAGGIVATVLAASFGLSRLNNAMNRTGL